MESPEDIARNLLAQRFADNLVRIQCLALAMLSFAPTLRHHHAACQIADIAASLSLPDDAPKGAA